MSCNFTRTYKFLLTFGAEKLTYLLNDRTGVMSGCYHVCPNHTNFQFDTAFMYTISVLILLTIYQTRHPDINANAYTAFGVLVRICLQNKFTLSDKL